MASPFVKYIHASQDWVSVSDLSKKLSKPLGSVYVFVRENADHFEFREKRLSKFGPPSMFVRSKFTPRK